MYPSAFVLESVFRLGRRTGKSHSWKLVRGCRRDGHPGTLWAPRGARERPTERPQSWQPPWVLPERPGALFLILLLLHLYFWSHLDLWLPVSLIRYRHDFWKWRQLLFCLFFSFYMVSREFPPSPVPYLPRGPQQCDSPCRFATATGGWGDGSPEREEIVSSRSHSSSVAEPGLSISSLNHFPLCELGILNWLYILVEASCFAFFPSLL